MKSDRIDTSIYTSKQGKELDDSAERVSVLSVIEFLIE